MSFILEGWARDSVSYNTDSMAVFTYKTTTDDSATIAAPDYFVSQKRALTVDDLIVANATDGLVTLQVIGLDPAVTTVIVVPALDENALLVLDALQLKSLTGGGNIVRTTTPIGQFPQLVDSDKHVFDGTRLGVGTDAPDLSSIGDFVSTTGGLLPPRMTTAERDAISSPADGLIIYNTTTGKFNGREAGAWLVFTLA